jgi:chaperonin GroES
MNIKPLGDRIVIKTLKEKEVTASGIVLPETIDKEKKAEGEVVAVGPGKLLESGARGQMEVIIGNKVLFEKWGGEDVTVEGVDYKIVSQEKVLAILS